MKEGDNYWEKMLRRTYSRRELVRTSAKVGAVLAGTSLLGCGGTNTPQPSAGAATKTVSSTAPTRGGTITLHQAGNFSGLEAVTGTGGSDQQFLWTVFDNLVAYDKDMKPTAERSLSESWENPDPLTYIFHLRKGIKFHDGTAFNAAAVKANFEYAVDPNVKSNVRADLTAVKTVEVVDENTAKFVLSSPHAPLITILGDRTGMMSSPDAIKKWGKDYIRNPVGTGAFTFVEQVLDDHVTVKRNPNYWQKDHPYVDEVTWKIIPDGDVAMTGLKTGQLNLMWAIPGKEVAEIKSSNKLKFMEREGVWVDMIYLNSMRPPFNNRNVRRALAYAIDRATIAKEILYGTATAAGSSLGPGNWEFDPNAKGLQYDPAKAKEELTAGGTPNGFKFDMRVMNSPIWVQVAQAIKAQAAKVGIEIDLKVLPAPDYYMGFISNAEGSSFLASFSGRADPWQTLAFIFGKDGTYGKAGTQYLDTKLNGLIDKARETYDPQERKRLYNEADKLALDEAYGVFLWYPRTLVAMDPRVRLDVFGDGKPHLGQGDVWIGK